MYIHPPPNGSLLPYSLFKAFMFRYLERYFCVDDSSYLYKSFRYFHLLLMYFDPQLASHLDDQEFPPELYSPQWFLTLYSRSLPLPIVLRLWDVIIAVDDPSFIFFVGLCLLRRKRDQLLLADTGRIPEILQVLQFSGPGGSGEEQEAAVDSIMGEAVELYKNTPRCFLRNLRLCCVSSTELTPPPHPSKWSTTSQQKAVDSPSSAYAVNMNELDKTMAVQAARSCFMLSAQELVDSVAPIASRHRQEALSDNSSSASTSTGDFSLVPQQYVIIDIRSFEECNASGGGNIPRAIQLEPDFLNRPEAFEVWMQHFDGTRGCNIVIVDLPPSQWQGVALWRRLLLGDGDSSFDRQSGASSTGFEDREENKRKVHALSKEKRMGSGKQSSLTQERDTESVFAKEEAAAASMDLTRPAVLLALALQRNSFSHVSVLDGGFPALVQQLISSRGTAEPVVINHEPETWAKFLKSTGREHLLQAYNSSTTANKRNTASKSRGSIVSCADSDHGSGMSSASHSSKDVPRKVGDLSPLEVSQIAFQVADRLQHPHMRAILKTKLDELMTQDSSDAGFAEVH
jgi:hypothetical protein